MTENLIINGVDHAKFDLEWVKKAALLMVLRKQVHTHYGRTFRDVSHF